MGEGKQIAAMSSITCFGTAPNSAQCGALLLRVREVARLLAISERQVWVLIGQGHLTPVRPPGIRAIRLARTEVEALVASWCRN